MEHRFGIDLQGLIDLLSRHLYSGPEVYLRELLQNAVDAIAARRRLDPAHAGRIELEVLGADPPTLLVADDGVGLTEEEVHGVLATIGQSSKRGPGVERPTDFLGRFGIGLLSGFLVSDELVFITRSARRPDAPALEWRGRSDGSYALRPLTRSVGVGTRVYLRARPGREALLETARVEGLARRYGRLLEVPILLVGGPTPRLLNDDRPPWRAAALDPATRREELLDYGETLFSEHFFDAVPIEGPDLAGAAYVLPYRPSLATPPRHRVYLKGMLVGDRVENLVPEWAFFVRCVVDARALRPTASRERLYEDEALCAARRRIGVCLRRYLRDLARADAARWRRFLSLHALSIKAVALHDDELYGLFVDRLPFETSLGELTLPDARAHAGELLYARSVDAFRQVAAVAAAQGRCVINAGYTYDEDLLRRYAELRPGARVRPLDPDELAEGFDLPSPAERERLAPFLARAEEALAPFDCAPRLRRFRPDALPALYTADEDAVLRRSLDRARGETTESWSGVLGDLRSGIDAAPARLFLNLRNPLVRRMSAHTDPSLQRRCVELLYVHSLLAGSRPLGPRELSLFSDGLLGVIEWGLSEHGA